MLLASGMTVTAQNFQRRGFALGVDRDTLLYLIASPFDNWYLNVGGGIQTFIGNELESDARRNKLNFNGRVEIGKWIIPDVAISLRFSLFNVDGHSTYGKQPFINKADDTPTGIWDQSSNDYYYLYHAHAFSAMGFVIFDWTNFLGGYERGKHNRWHVFMPLGLGMSVLYGEQRNPFTDTYEVGTMRYNRELAFSGGLGLEYVFSEYFTVNAAAELFGSESTWDWSPYNNARSIFDLIPSFSVCLKVNFINEITKYNMHARESRRVKTFHEFQTVGSQTQLENREVEVKRLAQAQDSLVDLIVEKNGNREDLMRKYDSLANLLDDINRNIKNYRQPENMLAELLDFNESHGLPAVVVYFQLDRYEIDYNADRRLQSFAREVNRLDDSLEFFLLGAADSATGTVKHNIWLSEQRCNAVYNRIVKQYGVNAKRLLVRPLGGITDYEPQENNRMGMLILRTPETEEIVERWLRTGSSGINGAFESRNVGTFVDPDKQKEDTPSATETQKADTPDATEDQSTDTIEDQGEDSKTLGAIYVENGRIVVVATEGDPVQILDANGNEVLTAVSSGKDNFIVAKGAYMVKLGNRLQVVLVD